MWKTLEQQGWRISFSDYQPYPVAPLPGKIQIETDALRFRLVKLDWRAASDGGG